LCVLNAGRTGNELHSTPFTGMHEAPCNLQWNKMAFNAAAERG
jgi:hypothetical protein